MILKACALALISATVAFILRELGVRAVPAFCAVCGAVILSLGLDALRESGSVFKDIAALGALSDAASDILKIVGVGYVFGFCSDICTDVGEARIASALTLIGRLEIVGIALPYFKKIIDAGISLIR